MPKISRYSSLRIRLVLPFALLGLSVSVVLSLLAYRMVDDLDERGIRQILKIELEDFRVRRQRNPMALPIETRLIQGYFLPDSKFAGISAIDRFVEVGLYPVTILELEFDGKPRTALLADVSGKPFALLYDNTSSRASLDDLARLLLGAIALMTALSTLLGLRLAGQVVRPIASLLREVSERAQHAQWSDELEPLFGGRYPNDEIGHLAEALDSYARRLHQFVQRERHFVGDVSHELRTPIAIIRSTAEVLAESPDLPPAARERLLLIERRSARLAELLDALLMLARESETHALADADNACPIADVISDALADCQGLLAGKPVSTQLTLHDRPILPVERPMAHAVFSNLLANACIHTRQGRVEIDLYGDRVEIADTGAGIAADRFPDIFRRHVKGPDSPGSGLGLSIVARLTEVMGWTIELDSREGEGTQVRIRFSPRASANLADEDGAGAAGRPASSAAGSAAEARPASPGQGNIKVFRKTGR